MKFSVLLFCVMLISELVFSQRVIKVNNYQELIMAKNSIRGGTDSVVIELSDGTYYLEEALLFDALDGRSGNNTVTYKSAENATVVLSGGYLVKGTWEYVDEKEYFKLNLPSSAPLDKIKHVRNLYINGNRATRARSKNITIDGVYKNNQGNYDGVYLDCSQIAKINDISVAELNQLVRWKDHYYKVVDKKNLDGKCYLKIKNFNWAHTQSYSFAPSHYMPFSNYERGVMTDWYFENTLDFLDEPNEWFYDYKHAVLYYYPKKGENLKTASVIIPVLNELVMINADTKFNKVKNLIFEGIRFSYTNWDFPSKEGFFTLQGSIITNGNNSMGADNNLLIKNKKHIDAAFQVDGCENLILKNNVFSHIGSNALNIHNNANNIFVTSNTFLDISANAIRVGNVFNQKIEAIKGEGKVSEVLIKNNLISSVGLEFKGSIGIEFMYANDVRIQHNEIYDVPYIGISAGIGWEGSWSDNSTSMADSEIIHNKIVGAMSVAKEGGSIYTNNRHNNIKKKYGLIISENYIDELSNPPPSRKQAPIHHDEGSDNILVKKNIIETTRPNYIWVHKSCKIEVDSTYVSPLKTTNLIGVPRRCSTNFQVTNTLTLQDSSLKEVKDKVGIQLGYAPPLYQKLIKNNIVCH